MTWMYQQSTGYLTLDGVLHSVGYSGRGEGKNNPEMQTVHNTGPIPCGAYTIGEAYDDLGGKGSCVLPLTPSPDNEMFGRSGFLMHGDSISHPGEASEGCVIMPPTARHDVDNSDDDQLIVTA
jgi:hypothetical protein